MFKYGQDHLTASKALQITRGELQAELSDTARIAIQNNRNIVEQIVQGEEAVYGINTGFGFLCD